MPPGPSRSVRFAQSTDALVLSMDPRPLARAVGESWPDGRVELTPETGLQAGVDLGSLLDETVAQAAAADSRVLIVEVSVRTGFVNQSHSARLFRRAVGVSPTEYRRQA